MTNNEVSVSARVCVRVHFSFITATDTGAWACVFFIYNHN